MILFKKISLASTLEGLREVITDSAQMTCEASLGTVVGGKWSLELQLLLQYAVT